MDLEDSQSYAIQGIPLVGFPTVFPTCALNIQVKTGKSK
jgi:hypothetical protein